MRVWNRTKNTVLAERGVHAHSVWSRALGLMGRAMLPPGEALLLDPGGSIHTFFMRFPIDVVFLDRDWTVLRTLQAFPPWRISPIVWGCRYVLELPSGKIAASATSRGDVIEVAD